jgi:hypothetical protein
MLPAVLKKRVTRWGREDAMIELTEQQMQAVAAGGESPLMVVDPKTKTPYVLLRKDVYERLTGTEIENGPWTDEEMDQLAAEAGELLDQYRKEP